MKFTFLRKKDLRYTTIAVPVICVFVIGLLVYILLNTNYSLPSNSIENMIIVTIIFISGASVFAWWLWYGVYKHYVIIEEEGIRYIRRKTEYFLRWGEIASIRLEPKNQWRGVDFGAMLAIATEEEKDTYVGKINEHYFRVQYRPELLLEIQKHCEIGVSGLSKIVKEEDLVHVGESENGGVISRLKESSFS